MSPTASRSESAPIYSAKQYDPLNHEEDEIRLLQIDLEGGNHELRSNISLRVSKPQYCALSYTWGDQTIRKYISIDGEQFPMSRNLSQALRGVIRISIDYPGTKVRESEETQTVLQGTGMYMHH